LLDRLGHIVAVKPVGLGPLPGTVLEDKAVLEPRTLNQRHSSPIRSFVFSTEPNNEIARDSHVRYRHTNQGQHVLILRYSVHTFHSLQDRVAATLSRHVKIAADLRQIAHRLEQIVGHVVGKIGEELDPLDALYVVNSLEEVCEAARSPF